jgi:hypothetical protein
LSRPLRGRLTDHVEVENATTIMGQHQKRSPRFERHWRGSHVLNASSERQVANHLESVLWVYMHLQGLNLLTVLG